MKETPKGRDLAFADFSKHCSDKWKGLGDEDKKKYVELGEQDRERYKAEMEAYQQTTDTGSKTGSKGRRKKDKSLPKRNL